MPTPALSDFKTRFRLVFGDTDSSNYLFDDTRLSQIIVEGCTSIANEVHKVSEHTIAGAGQQSVTLPASVDASTVFQVLIEPPSGRLQRSKIGYIKTNDVLDLSQQISAGNTLVIQFTSPWEVGVDDIPLSTQKILLVSCIVEGVKYLAMHRADFEQWAAINRSDMRLSELLSLGREKQFELSSLVSKHDPGYYYAK